VVKWVNPPTQDQLRRVVKQALEDEGLAQAEVCRRLGLSTKHLNCMLQGKSHFTLAWADRILELCGARLVLTLQYPEEEEK
jgi:transcriptional regulator with XRE-family HTH domain